MKTTNAIGKKMLHWWLTKDGDDYVRDVLDRHYSRRRYRDGRKPKLFIGPGQYILLRTLHCDAIFAWRRFIDGCIDERTRKPQDGVNCAFFRNESGIRSSDLIRQADAIADFCWPGMRHYTYVNAEKIRSTNPGYCFIAAGWKRVGMTKGGLFVLEYTSDNLPKQGSDNADYQK